MFKHTNNLVQTFFEYMYVHTEREKEIKRVVYTGCPITVDSFFFTGNLSMDCDIQTDWWKNRIIFDQE